MENLVEAVATSYDDLLQASAMVFEARIQSKGQKTQQLDSALENLKDKTELFRVSCDRAEELVESMKQRIGSQSLVDEATGISHPTVENEDGSRSIPPISAVRLEQMSKAVRWLVIELQQHGGGSSGSGGGGGGVSGGATQIQPERSPEV